MLERNTLPDQSIQASQVGKQPAQLGCPTVSVGVPVYNGASSLRAALDSLLAQTFSDFELIISDNASTDGTEAICREYAARDSRVRYVRQATNIGSAANFKYLLEQAHGEYFMWAAGDDRRSSDFIEVNFKFLTAQPDYVASTSPNGFEGPGMDARKSERFALEGDVFERFHQFYEFCWISHAMFYCLARTQALRKCEMVGQSFIAADWAIILCLLKQGKLNRTEQGWILFGTGGISNSPNAFSAFRNRPIELFLPLYQVSMITFALTRELSFVERGRIFISVARVNFRAIIIQAMFIFHKCMSLIKHRFG